MKFNNRNIEEKIFNELKNKYLLSFYWEVGAFQNEIFIHLKQKNKLILNFSVDTSFAAMIMNSNDPILELDEMNDSDIFQQFFILFIITLFSDNSTSKISIREKLIKNFDDSQVIDFINTIENVYFNTLDKEINANK